MSERIFISVASADRAHADRIISFLEANRFPCWVSFRDVPVGENYQESITRAVRSAKILIVLISRHANLSEEILKELSLAARYKLAIVPLRMEDVQPSDALAYELATRQWIDLFRDWKGGSERLLSQLASYMRADGSAATLRSATAPYAAPPLGLPERRFADSLAAASAPKRPVTGGTFVPPRTAPPRQPVALRENRPAADTALAPPPVQPAAASPATSAAPTPVVPRPPAPSIEPAQPAPARAKFPMLGTVKFVLVAGVFGILLFGWIRQGEPSLLELFFWAILLLGCARLVGTVWRACVGGLRGSRAKPTPLA